MSSLLEDLREVAGEILPSELPAATEVLQIVGAIVKVLEGNGTSVPDSLKAAPPADPAAPAAPAADPTAAQAEIDRLKAQLAALQPAAPSDAPSTESAAG